MNPNTHPLDQKEAPVRATLTLPQVSEKQKAQKKEMAFRLKSEEHKSHAAAR